MRSVLCTAFDGNSFRQIVKHVKSNLAFFKNVMNGLYLHVIVYYGLNNDFYEFVCSLWFYIVCLIGLS